MVAEPMSDYDDPTAGSWDDDPDVVDYDPDDDFDSDAAEYDRLSRAGFNHYEIMRHLRRLDQEGEATL
jgi:hypothetical protein